nr:MAG TPA: BRO family protein [Caudoviricetes sp.]
MQELKIFENEQFGKVRTLEIENEAYFVGKDVADILGYQNGSRDINLYVEEEDRLKYKISTLGQLREQILVNESVVNE